MFFREAEQEAKEAWKAEQVLDLDDLLERGEI
jgi:hypothetical protein